MRAIIVARQGSPVAENVRLELNWPEPASSSPGPGQVLVRTLATALNQMDLWVGRGVPGLSLTYPRVSGCDACGVVETVGPGVDAAWVGKRVIVNAAVRQPDRVSPTDPPGSTFAPAYELIGEHHNGMLTEKFVAPAANLAAVGEVDAAEAAAFGLCTLTAYSGMITKARLRPGQSVLITGIGGGVATSAMGLANWMGCSVAVTSRHQWKLDRAREVWLAWGGSRGGAQNGSTGAPNFTGILDNGQDWSKEVRAWTVKRGVDMALDSSGKATHLNCIKSLARGGAYVTPGATAGPDATTDLARLFWNQLRVLGTTMGTNEEFVEVAALLRAGLVRPVVDQVFRPEQAREAYARLEAAEQFGKVVIQWT